MDQFHPFKDLPIKERIDIYISLAVICLFGGFIYLLINPSSPMDNNLGGINTLIEDSVKDSYEYLAIDEDVYYPLSDEEVKVISPEAVKALPTLDIKGVRPQGNSVSLEHTTSIIESENTKYYSDTSFQYSKKINSDIDPPSVNIEETEELSVESEASVLSIPNPENIPEEKLLPTETQSQCVIILGAFGRQSNVDKLLRQLKADDFDAFTVPYKSLTRVGVKVSCSESSRMLRKVRTRYTSDAVVLKN